MKDDIADQIADSIKDMGCSDTGPIRPPDRFPQSLVEERPVRVETEATQFQFLDSIGEVIEEYDLSKFESKSEAILDSFDIPVIRKRTVEYENLSDSTYLVVHECNSMLEGFMWMFQQFARSVPLQFTVRTVEENQFGAPVDSIQVPLDMRTGGGFDSMQVFVPFPGAVEREFYTEEEREQMEGEGYDVWGPMWSKPEDLMFDTTVTTRTELCSLILLLWSHFGRNSIGVGTAEGPLTY